MVNFEIWTIDNFPLTPYVVLSLTFTIDEYISVQLTCDLIAKPDFPFPKFAFWDGHQFFVVLNVLKIVSKKIEMCEISKCAGTGLYRLILCTYGGYMSLQKNAFRVSNTFPWREAHRLCILNAFQRLDLRGSRFTTHHGLCSFKGLHQFRWYAQAYLEGCH